MFHRRHAILARHGMLAAALGFGPLSGCEPYRIEHRTRPAYYDRVSEVPLPEEVVEPDGTIIKFSRKAATPERTAPSTTRDDGTVVKEFTVREETEDGEVILRCLMPAHVVGNLLHCILNEEYELVWEQLLAEETRRTYAASGAGLDEFTAFFVENRTDLARMLNRMRIGLSTYEVAVNRRPDGIIEARFWPQTASLFRFKVVEMRRQDGELKLVMIR